MNDKVFELIEQLASKLGTTAEYLWAVLIRQAGVSAATGLIFILATTVFLAIYLKWLFRKAHNEELDIIDNEGNCVMAMVGGIVALLAFIFALCSVQNVVTGFMNPEYWALKEVLDHLK